MRLTRPESDPGEDSQSLVHEFPEGNGQHPRHQR